MNQNAPVNTFVFCLALVTAVAAAEPSEPVRLDRPDCRFQVWPDSGRYEIRDKAGGVTWQSNPYQLRFGEATLAVSGAQPGSTQIDIFPGWNFIGYKVFVFKK